MEATGNLRPSKLSKEFAARLDSTPAHEKLYAVVLLEARHERTRSHRHKSRQRRVAVGALRKACGPVLVKLDEILSNCGGRRIDDEVSALGTVAIEATPAGIKKLARLRDVKSVLEDQNVSLLA